MVELAGRRGAAGGDTVERPVAVAVAAAAAGAANDYFVCHTHSSRIEHFALQAALEAEVAGYSIEDCIGLQSGVGHEVVGDVQLQQPSMQNNLAG